MDWALGIAITIHVVISLVLILLILLHSGRGGGLSDMFGGGMGPAAARGSTVMDRNLQRITVVTGVLFGVSTLVLSWLMA